MERKSFHVYHLEQQQWDWAMAACENERKERTQQLHG